MDLSLWNCPDVVIRRVRSLQNRSADQLIFRNVEIASNVNITKQQRKVSREATRLNELLAYVGLRKAIELLEDFHSQ